MKFEYEEQKGNQTYRIVEPYKILSEMHCYLYGYCRERSDFRTFKLTRIWNIQKKGFICLKNEAEFNKQKHRDNEEELIDVQLRIQCSEIRLKLLHQKVLFLVIYIK
jgi:predicted DNA-binding transcriptional regulator YafY